MTVAIPAMIEPRTRKIRARGGIRISNTLPTKRRSNLPTKGTGGAALGLISAKIRMNAIYRPTKTSPGTSAPRNISPALVEMMSNSDGIDSSPVASLKNALRAVPA